MQLIETLMTFALEMVPEPLVTEQVWLGVVGLVLTVTKYVVPLFWAENSKSGEAWEGLLSSPLLFWSTTELPVASPVTVPETVYPLTQAMDTDVTLPPGTFPEPLVTVQVWPVGWVDTVTA